MNPSPDKPRRNTSRQQNDAPAAAPWEEEGPAQKRAAGQAPMIGQGVRHTPGQQNDFSEGIEPNAWMSKPGGEIETSGAGRSVARKDYFGGVVMLLLGIGVCGIGVAGIMMSNKPVDPLVKTDNLFYGYWAAAAAGLIALLRGVMLLLKK